MEKNNDINTPPLAFVADLMSVSKQVEQDSLILQKFSNYLRANLRFINIYQGVCDSLLVFFERFDASQPFSFDAVVANLKQLPKLTAALKSLHSLLGKCESYPERHDKKKVFDYAKAVSVDCQVKMGWKDINEKIRETDNAINKVRQLMDLFSKDELIRHNELCKQLVGVRDSLSAEQDSMWYDDYMNLSSRIDSYANNPDLNESVIKTLRADVSSAVTKRSDYIHFVENNNRRLTTNKHISEDYFVMRSRARTKSEFDRNVGNLLDRLDEIRSENWSKVFNAIGKTLLFLLKVVGIGFVIIWSIIKVFFHHDDD